MATKRAKVLDEDQLQDILDYLSAYSGNPESDRLKVLLSFRAGLRVSEIANLTIDAVTTPDGRIARTISLFSHMTKYGKERQVPMHPEIADAIRIFRRKFPEARRFALGRAGDYQKTNALTVWFWNLYQRLGFEGCSSHSGRRTCLTRLAQQISASGGSLRDVQLVAGHARLDTTERYLEPSNRQAIMIAMLGDRKLDHLHSNEVRDRHQHRLSHASASAMRASAPKSPKRSRATKEEKLTRPNRKAMRRAQP